MGPKADRGLSNADTAAKLARLNAASRPLCYRYSMSTYGGRARRAQRPAVLPGTLRPSSCLGTIRDPPIFCSGNGQVEAICCRPDTADLPSLGELESRAVVIPES
jgi:hypothetical protein